MALNISGWKIGRLTVTSEFVRNSRDETAKNKGKRQWRCICECGRESWPITANLMSGNTSSCGVCSRKREKRERRRIR